MRELTEIRLDINAVDEKIRALFLQRMELALEVAQAKAQTNDKILKPEREAEIIAMRSAGIPDELRLKYIALLQNIMRSSREYQYSSLLALRPDKFPLRYHETELYPQNVYYQGVPGAYQELAAHALFPDCAPQPVDTWEQVFQAVHTGAADAGVVPVENTTAGTVSEVYDLLLQYDLSIVRSHIKKIRHCLAAVPGTTLEEIKRVCSHPHALPQCSAFIASHGLEAFQMPNTAMAAQSVCEKGDHTTAAICSKEAAARYGLTVLAEGINDLAHNETRFIAVSRELIVLPEHNCIEIAFHIPNQAGSLSAVVSIFADYGVDMVGIYSRPMKDSPWCYVFYVDFTGNMADHNIQALLYQLHEELPFIKVIGSYRVTEPTED
ncbi:MAG: ACT domain-containing protein [Clostridia bacterium]|nr:ACT domain-containing protein [Clostridia bacterium]